MPFVHTIKILGLGLCMGLLCAPAPAGEELLREAGQRAMASQQRAIRVAREHGLPLRGRVGEIGEYEMVGVEESQPVILQTQSVRAGISTAVAPLRGAPWSLAGTGWSVGVWDSGVVRGDHVELTGRVTVNSAVAFANHPTFVAGIIASKGINPDAIGAAPQARIRSWHWTDDRSTLAAAAASGPGQNASSVYVSNHSYGELVGWAQGNYSGNTGRHFFGSWDEENPPAKSDNFGRYTSSARDWDILAAARPWVLPIKAVGNDRSETPPSPGATFYYNVPLGDGFEWRSAIYDPAIHPAGDGVTDGGYDTIPPWSTAKNVLAIGSVRDAVDGSGQRDITLATPSPFSGWGPTDDGRIKPDLVANGQGVFSITGTSSSAYAGGSAATSTISGTSFSAPGAAGAAILLQQSHEQRFPGSALRAASLKGLLIHTADDLVQPPAHPGPDYATGWGLVNARAGVEFLAALQGEGATAHLFEERVAQADFTWARTFSVESGTEELRATLSWTDPPGPVRSGLDNRTPVLVNDLELRLLSPSTVVHHPYVLDPENPSAPAGRGANSVDPVEQVRIAEPAPGDWRLLVFRNGDLEGGGQDFSLLVTGGTLSVPTAVDEWLLLDR